ncbi:MAG: hypothetical protein FGM54_08890 [Chitinophagaceae bacterium]|nr:hypothetical protein [Chitinophagaceae bacterium]
MEDKNPMQPENSNTPNPKKGPKFNLYWIYGLFVVILLFIQFGGRDFTRSAKEESFQTINSLYIQKNLVDSMVVFTKSVDVYLKKDSLKKPEYSALLKALRGNEKGPHFSFTIGDYNQFRDDIKEAEMNKPIDSRVKITYAEDARSGWLGFILAVQALRLNVAHKKGGFNPVRIAESARPELPPRFEKGRLLLINLLFFNSFRRNASKPQDLWCVIQE